MTFLNLRLSFGYVIYMYMDAGLRIKLDNPSLKTHLLNCLYVFISEGMIWNTQWRPLESIVGETDYSEARPEMLNVASEIITNDRTYWHKILVSRESNQYCICVQSQRVHINGVVCEWLFSKCVRPKMKAIAFRSPCRSLKLRQYKVHVSFPEEHTFPKFTEPGCINSTILKEVMSKSE